MNSLIDNTGRPYIKVEYDKDGNFEAGYREDGLVDVPIELSLEEWGTIAMMAHEENITLNDFLVKCIEYAINTDRTT